MDQPNRRPSSIPGFDGLKARDTRGQRDGYEKVIMRISTVIPTYNRAHLVGRAVESVLSQCLEGDEVIVVDDGSTDNTEEALKSYAGRIRYVRIPNSGAGAARNAGVREASGDLVAFLDSDDEWMPGKLQMQRALMQARPELLFAFSNFAITDEEETVHRRFLGQWHNDPRPWDVILGAGFRFSTIAPLPAGVEDFTVYVGDLAVPHMTRFYVLTSSFIVRRVEAGDALHFAEDLPTWEDLECYGRLALRGPAAYLDCETTWQHATAADRLTDIRDVRRADAHLKILQRVWGSDTAFLEQHGDLYEKAMAQARVHRTKCLLRQGETAQARRELRTLPQAPALYRMLALLPGPLMVGFVNASRVIRRV